jgi:hypothetical protein
MTVVDHYERLLGPVDSWMVADVEAAIARADAELDAIGLPPKAAGIAVDLGAAKELGLAPASVGLSPATDGGGCTSATASRVIANLVMFLILLGIVGPYRARL